MFRAEQSVGAHVQMPSSQETQIRSLSSDSQTADSRTGRGGGTAPPAPPLSFVLLPFSVFFSVCLSVSLPFSRCAPRLFVLACSLAFSSNRPELESISLTSRESSPTSQVSEYKSHRSSSRGHKSGPAMCVLTGLPCCESRTRRRSLEE